MRPFYVALITVVHGLFTSMALLVVVDVFSPTFNVNEIPAWTGSQATVVIVIALTASFALGIVMHTISRGLFHGQKQRWTLDILASGAVRSRLAALGGIQPSPGGVTYAELADEELPERVMKGAAYMHAVEYQVLVRAPHVFDTIQMYRDQYRLARVFVIPLLVLGLVLPFWDPVAALDGAGSIGPFPIIRTQAFLLGILAASVSYIAFRERAYRYAAAKVLAWVTLEDAERDRSG